MKLPNNESAVADVRNFVEDNHVKSKRGSGPMLELEELTPDEFLDYWLKWNGIIGYTHHLVEVLIDIGWTAPKTPVSPDTDFKGLAKGLYDSYCIKSKWSGVEFKELPDEAKAAWLDFARFKFQGE